MRLLLCGCRTYYLESLAGVYLAESTSLDMVRGRVGLLLEVVRGPLFVREEPIFESMLVGIGMFVLHVVVRNWPIMDFSADGAPDLAGLLGKLQ